ncbi:MAG: YfcE family phosphodiesterase [Bacilli bacterium]|nr:YfcE family phosphodiesterase [Bacilli bacterium]
MIIVCTSDSHGRLDILENIKNRHPRADLYIDAGDSERYDFELDPYLTVKGNCDYKIETKYRIFNIEGIKIYVFHGDHTLLSLENLSMIAKKNSCDMIIHGHTHKSHYSFFNGVHILCPGSVALPRTREGCTYALIHIKDKEVEVEIQKVNK